MTLGFAALQQLHDVNDATSYTTTSYTPAASRLLVAFIVTRGAQADPTVTGNNVTWSQKAAINQTDMRLMMYVALSGTSSTATGLTANYGAVTQTGQHISVFEIGGALMGTDPLNSIVQAPTGTGTATSGSITLANPAHSLNLPISAWCHAANEATTPRASWTEIHDGNFATPVSGMETQYYTSFELTASASWTTSSVYAGIAAEVKGGGTTVTTDFTTISTCTSLSSPDTWTKIAGAAAGNPAADTDFKIEGTTCVLSLCGATSGTTDVGVGVRLASTFDGTNKHLFHWRTVFTSLNMATKANQGVCFWASDEDTVTPTDYIRWFLDGSDTDAIGGWRCYVINLSGTPDAVSGTTTMTALKSLGFVHRQLTGIGTKYANTGVDVIRTGTGLTIVDGKGQTPATFSDIYTIDSANINAFGVITSANYIFYCAGKLNFGSTGQLGITAFKDTNQVLVWKLYPVSATFYAISVAGASTQKTTFKLGTYVPLTGLASGGCVIRGAGDPSGSTHAIWTLTTSDSNQVTKLYGSTFSELDSAALTYNAISFTVTSCTTTNGSPTVTTTNNFNTAGVVGGMLVTGTGIPDDTHITSVDSDTQITLDRNATANGTVTLTFAHNNEMRFCIFNNFADIDTGGCLIDNCTFQNVKTTAPISGTYALIIDSTTEMSRITNSKFINCNRAIKITAIGTYDFVGLTFSGNAYDIENSSAGTVTINCDPNSNASTSINTGGGSTNIVTSVTLTVTVKDENNNAIQGAQVFINKLTPTEYTSDTGNNAGDGDLVVNETVDTDTPQTGTITVWDRSANKIMNYRYASWTSKTFTLNTEVTGTANTGGSSTTLIRKTGTSFLAADINEGDTVRNTTDGSWGVVDEIVDADTITLFEPLTGGSDNIWQEDDAYSFHKLAVTLIDNDDIVKVPIMNQQTNASGVATRTYTGAVTSVRINVRKSSEATKYQQYTTTASIASSGLSTTVVMIQDMVA